MSNQRAPKHLKRHQAAGRDGGWVCAFCGVIVQCPTCFPKTTSRATTDHIIPRSKGGSDRLENLQIACELCNHDKADRKHPQNARTAR